MRRASQELPRADSSCRQASRLRFDGKHPGLLPACQYACPGNSHETVRGGTNACLRVPGFRVAADALRSNCRVETSGLAESSAVIVPVNWTGVVQQHGARVDGSAAARTPDSAPLDPLAVD